jgi:hypothetical protein
MFKVYMHAATSTMQPQALSSCTVLNAAYITAAVMPTASVPFLVQQPQVQANEVQVRLWRRVVAAAQLREETVAGSGDAGVDGAAHVCKRLHGLRGESGGKEGHCA